MPTKNNFHPIKSQRRRNLIFVPMIVLSTLIFSTPTLAFDNPINKIFNFLRSLDERVGELESQSLPAEIAVDCATGESISAAIASVSKSVPLTIHVSGTCTEAINIQRDDLGNHRHERLRRRPARCVFLDKGLGHCLWPYRSCEREFKRPRSVHLRSRDILANRPYNRSDW